MGDGDSFYSEGSSGSRASTGGKKSVYNSAVIQLYRLDQLWIDTHTHARQIAYTKWNEDLDRIWLELYPDASPQQRKYMYRLNKAIVRRGLYGMNETFRLERPKLYNKLMHIQKRMLMKKEAMLRTIQDESGKGSKYDDESDFDIS